MKRDLRWKLRETLPDRERFTCYDHSVPGRPLPIGFYSHNLQYGLYAWGIASDLAEKLNIAEHKGASRNETQAKIALEDAYFGGLKWLEGKLEKAKCDK